MNNSTKPTAKTILGERITSGNAILQMLNKNKISVTPNYESLKTGDGCRILKLYLKNNNAVDINVPFGSLLGDPASTSSAIAFPAYAGVAASWAYGAVTGPLMDDNLGASLPMLRDLNRLFISKPVIVSGFEVITPDDAIGKNQRKEALTLIDFNRQFENANSIKGNFVPTFIDVTVAQVLSSPITFGTFKGAIYKMLAGAEASINIHIGAEDVNMFSSSDC